MIGESSKYETKPDPALQATIESLAAQLPPSACVWWVALSGGLDSSLLLQQLAFYCQQKPHLELKAIHIHHGLSPNAEAWVQHCESLCHALAIELTVKRVTVSKQTRQGVEQQARQARWHAFFEVIDTGQALWLGHHQDDQVETLLLKLLRGSGVLGASAMQPFSTRQQRYLLRPLLGIRKRSLKHAAEQSRLVWVEDESNTNVEYARNYLRHQVLPLIESQWPGYRQSLSRFVNHMQQSQRLLQQLAEQDWQRVGRNGGLWLPAFRELDRDRQINVFRYWVAQHTHYLPNAKALDEFLSQLATAHSDTHSRLDWGEWRVEQSGMQLYLFKPSAYTAFRLHWLHFPKPLLIEPLMRCLKAVPREKVSFVNPRQTVTLDWHDRSASLDKPVTGVRPPTSHEQVYVCSRQGGERCWPHDRGKATELKKVLQELKVPCWQRERIPLVFYNEQLVAAVGLFYDRRFLSPQKDAVVFTMAEASKPS